MTAFIEGSVQTPTGRIVPMTVHARWTWWRPGT